MTNRNDGTQVIKKRIWFETQPALFLRQSANIFPESKQK